jgi:hypothetical protein
MKQFLILSLLLISTNLIAQEKAKLVKVNFKESMNGYQITGYWQPLIVNEKEVTGAIIINLYNIKTKVISVVTNDYFTVSKEELNFKYKKNKDEEIITDYGTNEIILDNKKLDKINEDEEIVINDKNKNGKAELGEIKFYNRKPEYIKFIDLNGDNEKDLLLVQEHQGQRYITSYKVHIIKNGEIEDDRNNDGKNEPYNKLDEWSRIDTKNKTISIFSSGGASYNYLEIYKLVKDVNYPYPIYKLSKYVVEEPDSKTEIVYVTIYSVVNGVKKKIKKVISDNNKMLQDY